MLPKADLVQHILQIIKKFFCPAFSQTALDSTGAGDTYFALTSLGIAAKIDFKLVNLISSLASAYSVKNLSNKKYYNLTLLNKHLSHMFK